MEKITLITQDAVRIVGNYYSPANAGPQPTQKAVILLHMMPATKESWGELAEMLQQEGFHVLAIDERGHGESTLQILPNGTQKILDFRRFSDEEQQAKKLDVEAAHAFLEGQGIDASRILIGGASIGANLAIQYLAEHSECPAAFALSPGLNYRGVATEQYVANLRAGQNLFIAVAEDDLGAFEAAGILEEKSTSHITVKKFAAGGHGTELFSSHPEFIKELTRWLQDIFIYEQKY